jgi:hypothetical protein
MSTYQIKWPVWEKIVDPKFLHLVKNSDRYLLFEDSNGAASDFVAKKLLFQCLTQEYFKCILVHTSFKSIATKQFRMLKQIIKEYEAKECFSFNASTLEINCINGNRFISIGSNDMIRLSYIKNASSAWYQDNVSEKAFEQVTNKINKCAEKKRTEFIQEILIVNDTEHYNKMQKHLAIRHQYQINPW